MVGQDDDTAGRLQRLGLVGEGSDLAHDGNSWSEEVVGSYDSVGLSLGSVSSQSLGKLALTSKRIVWTPDDPSSGPACFIDLLKVVIHAQSSPSKGSKGGIYLQVEGEVEGEGEGEGAETTEVVLTPQDQSLLDRIFGTLCDCVAMNPDQGFLDQEEGEEDCGEGNGAAFFVRNGPASSAGDSDLQNLVRDDLDRFADA